jgi:hypothetical protein
VIDWTTVPVRLVELDRFVVPLHNISPSSLLLPDQLDPVLAFSRWSDSGPVDISDGRHRVLRALLRGETTISTRLLVLP